MSQGRRHFTDECPMPNDLGSAQALSLGTESHLTLRWSGVDSNFRFRARMTTVLSLRALSISLKLFGFRRRTCRPWGPKFRVYFPPAESHANHRFLSDGAYHCGGTLRINVGTMTQSEEAAPRAQESDHSGRARRPDLRLIGGKFDRIGIRQGARSPQRHPPVLRTQRRGCRCRPRICASNSIPRPSRYLRQRGTRPKHDGHLKTASLPSLDGTLMRTRPCKASRGFCL